jgi:tRNA dimethylallyltransferase
MLSKPVAIFLMGPTASGKSAFAVQLAHAINAEIISVDSALVFKGMDIGTAKPTLAERGGIPHHLLDILDPSEAYSTGQFRDQALALMADITARGKIPLLVGGTMLYFKALSSGLAQLPAANPDIRAQLEHDLAQFGKEALHQRLQAIDPIAAARIHPNDPQRIQRALEVFEITGKSLTAVIADAEHATLPYRVFKFIIAPDDRAVLHTAIAQRFQQMLQAGLIAEVEALYRRGDLSPALPAIRAVGYRQVWAYLAHEIAFATMTEQAIIATRQLAKRQFTWLRRETQAYHLRSGDPQLLAQALAQIKFT